MPDLMSSGYEISNSIKYFGKTDHPEHYMMAADVICLPSYREGFGSIIIEAGACCIPSIGYKINGLVDSVDNGSTGLLVQYQDIDILAEAMTDLLKDKKNRLLLGKNAYKHAVEKFSQDKITNLYRKSVLQVLDLNDT